MKDIKKSKIMLDGIGKETLYLENEVDSLRYSEPRKRNKYIDNVIDIFKEKKVLEVKQLLVKYNVEYQKQDNMYILDCAGADGVYIKNDKIYDKSVGIYAGIKNIKGSVIARHYWWDDRERVYMYTGNNEIRKVVCDYNDGILKTKGSYGSELAIRPLEQLCISNKKRFDEYFKIIDLRVKRIVFNNIKNIDRLVVENGGSIELYETENINYIDTQKLELHHGEKNEMGNKIHIREITCDNIALYNCYRHADIYIEVLKVKGSSVDTLTIDNIATNNWRLAESKKLVITKFIDKIVGSLKINGLQNIVIKDFQGIDLQIQWELKEKGYLTEQIKQKIRDTKIMIGIKTPTGNKRKIKLTIQFYDVFRYWDTNFYREKTGKQTNNGDFQGGMIELIKSYVEIVNETNDEVEFTMNYKDKAGGGTKDYTEYVVKNIKGKR